MVSPSGSGWFVQGDEESTGLQVLVVCSPSGGWGHDSNGPGSVTSGVREGPSGRRNRRVEAMCRSWFGPRVDLGRLPKTDMNLI